TAGTAATEGAEFAKIDSLDVTIVPTNRSLIRIEAPDVIYRTEKEKLEAVVNGILQEDNSLANGIRHYHERGQPVLVGTISIEKSEKVAELLKKAGVPHQVLNAKQHERESRVVAQAGRKGDPGSSRFFISLEDDLARIFGGERVKQLMFRLGMTEGVPIESRMVSKRIEEAQKGVEAQNFDARKHLLEYDDVMNKQRE